MQFIIAHKAEILAIALAISEALAIIPAVKANSIFQLVSGWLKSNKSA